MVVVVMNAATPAIQMVMRMMMMQTRSTFSCSSFHCRCLRCDSYRCCILVQCQRIRCLLQTPWFKEGGVARRLDLESQTRYWTDGNLFLLGCLLVLMIIITTINSISTTIIMSCLLVAVEEMFEFSRLIVDMWNWLFCDKQGRWLRWCGPIFSCQINIISGWSWEFLIQSLFTLAGDLDRWIVVEQKLDDGGQHPSLLSFAN